MLDIFASCDYKRRRSFDVPAAPQTCDVFFHMKAYMSLMAKIKNHSSFEIIRRAGCHAFYGAPFKV